MKNNQVTKFLILFVFVFLCSCDLFKSMCEAEKPPKQSTTLQQIVNDTNAGETIDLKKYSNEYDITDYNAEISKNLTIKNGSFQNTTLKIKAEVKLEKVQELSVETSANLTIRDSKLNNLLLGTNAESRSTNSGNTNFDLKVIVKNCEIAEKIKINSKAKLNIAGEKTKIAKIVVAVAAEVCKILCTTEVDTKKIENVITDENGEKPEEIKITQAYKITYHSNCGELENIEDFFSPDDGTISLPTDIFKRNDYIFAGWYEDKNCTQIFDNFNVSGKTADINVYAKWIENIYIYDFTIEVTNLPESVKALSLWGTPNNWEFENIQKQADIYISKVTNGTAIFKFDKINTAEPLWCQFVPMTSRDMELNQSTWWQTAFSGSSEYATAENNLVYDFTTKKAVDKMTLVLDITSIYGDVSNVFNCRFITYNYKNAFTVISPSNEESFEDLGGTGVYSYKLNLNDISDAWNGSPNNPNFSIVLLTDAQVKASVNKFNFSSYAYQFYSYGDMGVGNPIMPGNYAVYGKNCYENSEYKYYSGVAATVTDTALEVFVDMSQIMKAELKFFNSDTESEANLVTENMPVDLTDYKPYVFALIDGEKDPDNYVMTNETWNADLMAMTGNATFPTGELIKDAPPVPTTADINYILGSSINNWISTEMIDNKVTFKATGEDEFFFHNDESYTYKFAGVEITALDTEVELTEYFTEPPVNVTFADGVLTTGTEYTITFIPTGEHTAYVKVSKAGNTTGNENEVTEYTVTASEVATTISKLSHGEHILKVTGEITSDTITEIATAMTNNTTPQINLDLSGTTGLTEIADSAFSNCFRLTNITFPNIVESIGKESFAYCSSLTSLTIPDSVTTIGDQAFFDCANLKSIIIPDNVTSIGDNAFSKCNNLIKFEINSDNPNYSSLKEGIILCSKDQKTLIAYPSASNDITLPNVESIGKESFAYCSNLTSLTIPDSVTTIGDHAFSSSSLTNITIPNSVTSIGEYAFRGCEGLMSITIPDSVTSIGDYAFNSCLNLTDITISEKITTISNGMFRECGKLTNITIPDSVTSIGNLAFYYCSGLTSIEIPNRVTTIGSNAFSNCSSLTSITLPESVTSIETETFSSCRNLKTFEVSINNSNFSSSDDKKILLNKDKTVLIAYPSATGEIEIPNDVTNIEDYAFDSCINLKSVTIPTNVTNIGSFAFIGCTNLVNITIPEKVINIGRYAFSSCSNLTNITIPDSVTNIGECAFNNCSNLTSITIPVNVTSINWNTFNECCNLITVNYKGTQEQWEEIITTIAEGNDYLIKATINYEFTN